MPQFRKESRERTRKSNSRYRIKAKIQVNGSIKIGSNAKKYILLLSKANEQRR